ncbi:DUF6465 family protein [uncultured Ruminococcus sp.]|jgi:septal ring-binding cell division protein DamX|uniref:DUF6465 family protein n=1 Tax=uncultured Ruminococcus sp. TaxID=165186 RepID=UPI0025D6D01F|nr:DUF6465 family protein [uncultured Ruminococcus sp.]
MPDNKTAEKKVVDTAAAPVEEKKAPAAKAAAAKKPAEKKAVAKKPAAKKAPAKKPAAKKPAEKKAVAKKPAAKKPAAKKTAAAAVDSKVVIQAMGSEVSTADLIAKATKASGVKKADKVDIYIRPDVNRVYYVVNGDILGDFNLF